MDLTLIFSIIVVLALLKVSELHYLSKRMCKNSDQTEKFSDSAGLIESFETDRVNTHLTSSDDVYKPDFMPVQIDEEKYGAGSDLDPEVCLFNNKRSELNKIYGVYPKSKHSDGSEKFSRKEDVLYLYDQLSGPVDQGMANVMSAVSKRSKESLTNRARVTKNTYAKYFQDEFDGHENSRWWDNDELEIAM